MYAGKTSAMKEALFRHRFAEDPYVLIKPAKDDRYSPDHVVTHAENDTNSQGHESRVVNAAKDIYSQIPEEPIAIGIDEANFFDSSLIDVVHDLFDRGNAIYIATLNLDFARKPFLLEGGRSIGDLLAMATHRSELTAICEHRYGENKPCGNDARYTHALVNMNDGHVKVGGKEAFISVCDGCYRELNGLDSYK